MTSSVVSSLHSRAIEAAKKPGVYASSRPATFARCARRSFAMFTPVVSASGVSGIFAGGGEPNSSNSLTSAIPMR
jgi:hypothetical protein